MKKIIEKCGIILLDFLMVLKEKVYNIIFLCLEGYERILED